MKDPELSDVLTLRQDILDSIKYQNDELCNYCRHIWLEEEMSSMSQFPVVYADMAENPAKT